MKLMWKHWDLSESFLSVHLLKGKCFWSSHILLKYFSLASMLGSKLETSKRLIYIFRACLSLFIPFSIIKMKMLLKIPRKLLKILCILLKICYKSKLPLNNFESFFFNFFRWKFFNDRKTMDILTTYVSSGIFITAKIYQWVKLSLIFVKSKHEEEVKQAKA